MLEKSLRPIDGLEVEGGQQDVSGHAIEGEETKDSEEGQKQKVRSLVPEPTQKEIDEHNIEVCSDLGVPTALKAKLLVLLT